MNNVAMAMRLELLARLPVREIWAKVSVSPSSSGRHLAVCDVQPEGLGLQLSLTVYPELICQLRWRDGWAEGRGGWVVMRGSLGPAARSQRLRAINHFRMMLLRARPQNLGGSTVTGYQGSSIGTQKSSGHSVVPAPHHLLLVLPVVDQRRARCARYTTLQ